MIEQSKKDKSKHLEPAKNMVIGTETVTTLGNEGIMESSQRRNRELIGGAVSREFMLKNAKPVCGSQEESRNDRWQGLEKLAVGRVEIGSQKHNIKIENQTYQMAEDLPSSKLSSDNNLSFNQLSKTMNNNQIRNSHSTEALPSYRPENQDTSERLRDLDQSFYQIKSQLREQMQNQSGTKQIEGLAPLVTEDYSMDTTNTAFKAKSGTQQMTRESNMATPSRNQAVIPKQKIQGANLNMFRSIRPSKSLQANVNKQPVRIQNYKEMDHKLNSVLGVHNAMSIFNLTNLRHGNTRSNKVQLEPFESEMLKPGAQLKRHEQQSTAQARIRRLQQNIQSPMKFQPLNSESHQNRDIRIPTQSDDKPKTQVRTKRIIKNSRQIEGPAGEVSTTRDYTQDRKESMPISMSKYAGLLSEKPDTAQTKGMTSNEDDFIGQLPEQEANDRSNAGSKTQNTNFRVPSTIHETGLMGNPLNAFAETTRIFNKKICFRQESEKWQRIKTGEYSYHTESNGGPSVMKNQVRFSLKFKSDVTSLGTQEIDEFSRQSTENKIMLATKNFAADFAQIVIGKTPKSLLSSTLQSGEIDNKIRIKQNLVQRESRNFKTLQRPQRQGKSYQCPYSMKKQNAYQIDFISNFFWDEAKLEGGPKLSTELTERFFKLQALRQRNQASQFGLQTQSLLHRDLLKQSKSSTIGGCLPYLKEGPKHKIEDRLLFPVKEMEGNQHIKRVRQNQVKLLLHLAGLKIENQKMLRSLLMHFTKQELDDLQAIESCGPLSRFEIEANLQTTENGQDEEVFGNHYSFDQDVCLRNDSSQLAGFSQSQGKSPDYFVNVARTLRVDSGNNKNSASVLVGPVRSTLDNQSERSPGDYEDASLKFKQLKPHDHLMQSNELSGTNTVQQNKDTRHSQSNEIDLVLGKNLIEDVLEQNEPKEGDQKEGQQERVSPEAINNLPQNNQSRQARVLNQTKTVHSDNISLLEAFNSINEPKLQHVDSTIEVSAKKEEEVKAKEGEETLKLLSNSKFNSQRTHKNQLAQIKMKLANGMFQKRNEGGLNEASRALDSLIPIKLSQVQVCSDSQVDHLQAMIQKLKQPPEVNSVCQIDICTPEELALLRENKIFNFEWLNKTLAAVIKLSESLLPSRTYLPSQKQMPRRHEWKVSKLLKQQFKNQSQNQSLRGITVTEPASEVKIVQDHQQKIRSLQTQAQSLAITRHPQSPSASVSMSQRISQTNNKNPFILDTLLQASQSPVPSIKQTHREVILSKEGPPLVSEQWSPREVEDVGMFNLVFQHKKKSVDSRLHSLPPEPTEQLQNSNNQSIATEAAPVKVCKIKLFSLDLGSTLRQGSGCLQNNLSSPSRNKAPIITKYQSTTQMDRNGDYHHGASLNGDKYFQKIRNQASTKFGSVQQSQKESPSKDESGKFKLRDRLETNPIEKTNGGMDEEVGESARKTKKQVVAQRQQKTLAKGAMNILKTLDEFKLETIKIEEEIQMSTLPNCFEPSPRHIQKPKLANKNSQKDLVVLQLNQSELVTFKSEHSLIIYPLLQNEAMDQDPTPVTIQRAKEKFTGHSSLEPSHNGRGLPKVNQNQISLDLGPIELPSVTKSKIKVLSKKNFERQLQMKKSLEKPHLLVQEVSSPMQIQGLKLHTPKIMK